MHPEELAETEWSRWKKYAGKEKWKQPFPQLKMPVCQGQHDFSALSGVQVTELFLITAAGKWGLYQGTGIRTGNHYGGKGSLLPVPAFPAVGACARKPCLRSGGTAGALCIYCTGGFPGNHWKRGKKKGQMTLNR